MKINYHNRRFAGVTNSANGQVSSKTIFHYQQHGNILSARYHGGSIREGLMLGIVHEDNHLEFVYQHIDVNGELKNGYCTSIPEITASGKIRLNESWRWTHGGAGQGESVVEETGIDAV